jgi:translation initiation factor 1
LPERDSEFEEILRGLDKNEVRIIVRLETRKFRKPVTMILGLPNSKSDLEQIARSLKRRFATGGTAKEGTILLQGDHREDAREELEGLGYSSSQIEVQ